MKHITETQEFDPRALGRSDARGWGWGWTRGSWVDYSLPGGRGDPEGPRPSRVARSITDAELLAAFKRTRRRYNAAVIPCADGAWYEESIVPAQGQMALADRSQARLIPNDRLNHVLLSLRRLKRTRAVYKFSLAISSIVILLFPDLAEPMIFVIIGLLLFGTPFSLWRFARLRKIVRPFPTVHLRRSLRRRVWWYMAVQGTVLFAPGIFLDLFDAFAQATMDDEAAAAVTLVTTTLDQAV